MRPTRRQRDVLHQLWFRETGDGQACWIVTVGRGRYVLIVRTLMGTWERHSTVALRTLRALRAGGYVSYGDPRPMPAWFTPQDGEESAGREITITTKGRQTIGKDQNQ